MCCDAVRRYGQTVMALIHRSGFHGVCDTHHNIFYPISIFNSLILFGFD